MSPDSTASSIVNFMSGKAPCTSRMASLTWAIASAPRPAVPNWWSTKSREQSSSATEPSPGEQLIRMTAGDFIYLPREVPHAFRTTGTVPVRFLALTLPGGLLDIYDEVGVPTGRTAPARRPGVSDADVARWLELAPRYGLRVVGPPIPEAEA